jgi:hypothetical protein
LSPPWAAPPLPSLPPKAQLPSFARSVVVKRICPLATSVSVKVMDTSASFLSMPIKVPNLPGPEPPLLPRSGFHSLTVP